MKFIFYTLLFILICFRAGATDTLTTKLINAVYLEVVDTAAKYYYLQEFGRVPIFDEDDIKYELVSRNDVLKDVPLKDFIEGIKSDTGEINWRDYHLLHARVVNKAHLPKYTDQIRIFKLVPYNTSQAELKKLNDEGVVPVPIKKGMTQKQINQTQDKANLKYESRPIEEKQSFKFSKPIFSKDHQYVLIRLGGSDASALYIFRLVNGQWKKILRFNVVVA
ncbi:hypothetical protein [Mucilaginibacter sp. NFX135]|uniref:hypothetical protein n=1 Tax=Mucilaginibacter sp. NFX135 TaxID=3402687 RepID=UPI003AFAB848